MLQTVTLEPIGLVRTPWKSLEGMPIQPVGAAGAPGRAVLLPELAEGLRGLEGFDRVYLVYLFHVRAAWEPGRLAVVPFLDRQARGVFATRSPWRPNPVGLSVVDLVGVEGPVLHLRGVDVLDGTPLLDVKPYVPNFDSFPASRAGWLEEAQGGAAEVRSDGRFRPSEPEP